MSNIKSFFFNLKEARYNPLTVLHGLFYAQTPTYLWVLRHLIKIGPPWLRKHFEETYHAKVVTLDDAKKFITVDKEIDLRGLDQVLPFEHAKDIVLKNPHNIVAFECACRAQKEHPCEPTDVCLVIGEPFADLVRMTSPLRSRRITAEEALRIMEEERDRGHVQTAWFKTAMLDRFYAICNCCGCCCLGIKFATDYRMRSLLPSGYLAVIDDDCEGCGRCAKTCQFKAIELRPVEGKGRQKKRAFVIEEKCFGCGVCENRCKHHNITIRREPAKGLPLDIVELGAAT
jgi:ferredoxin